MNKLDTTLLVSGAAILLTGLYNNFVYYNPLCQGEKRCSIYLSGDYVYKIHKRDDGLILHMQAYSKEDIKLPKDEIRFRNRCKKLEELIPNQD